MSDRYNFIYLLQSIMNQYNYSDEKQRKEFLDVLFAHLEKEGMAIQPS